MTDDTELQLILDESTPIEGVETETPNTPVLYKKWFRTKTVGGFLTLTTWPETAMVAVDVGEVKDGKLTGSTKVWVSAIELSTYLDAQVQDQAKDYVRKVDDKWVTGEFMHYGGKHTDNGDVSRILKIAPEGNSLTVKCGHFQAKRSNEGAYIPNMNAPLSQNFIKLNRTELREMALRLRLALIGWAARDSMWITNINEKTK